MLQIDDRPQRHKREDCPTPKLCVTDVKCLVGDVAATNRNPTSLNSTFSFPSLAQRHPLNAFQAHGAPIEQFPCLWQAFPARPGFTFSLLVPRVWCRCGSCIMMSLLLHLGSFNDVCRFKAELHVKLLSRFGCLMLECTKHPGFYVSKEKGQILLFCEVTSTVANQSML